MPVQSIQKRKRRKYIIAIPDPYRIDPLWLSAIAVMTLLFTAAALSQSLVWQNAYGGPNNDAAYAISITHDDSFIVVGYTASFGAGGCDVYLLKVNGNGDTLWTRTFGGSGTDVGWAVGTTTDGGFVIAGETRSFGQGGSDMYVVRVDSGGNHVWSRTFGGTRDDAGRAVQQTTDGGYIVAGYIDDSTGVGGSIHLLKLSPAGDSLWARTVRPLNRSRAFSIAQTPDDGYIAAGSAVDLFEVGYLVRFDEVGDSLWSRTISGGDGASLSEVQLTADGGYITVGFSAFPYLYLTLTKWTSQGSVLWYREYPSPIAPTSNAVGRSVKQLLDGGYIVCGTASTFGGLGSKPFLFRVTAQGDTLWTRVFGGTNYNNASSIVAPQTGEFLVAGSTTSFGSGGFDVYVLRISTTTDVRGDNREPIPAGSHLYHNYPNPFNASTIVQFSLAQPGFVDLRILDILGREVATLLDEERSAGIHRVQWQAEDLSSGVYLCRLSVGEHTQTRKLLLLR